MLPNPFSKPLLPLPETNHAKNTDLVHQLLGPEKAAEYAALVRGDSSPRVATPTLEDLKQQAELQTALISKEALLKAREAIFIADTKKQLQEQVRLLTELSLLESKDGKLGITAIDNNFYPVPTLEQVAQYFTHPDKIDFFLKKREQGFTKLQITPIGRPLASFQHLMEQNIREHKAQNKLLDRDGEPLDLNAGEPVWISNEIKDKDTSGELLYFPTTFNKETPRGSTKQELLSDRTQPFPGYRITFLQEDLTIPRAGAGEEKAGRLILEADQSPIDYLKQLQDPKSPYFQEQGLTLEDWYTLFLTNLHTTNTVLDDYGNNTDSICYLLGMRLKSGDVPDAHWDRDDGRVRVSGSDPADADARCGVRVAVG